MSHVLSERYGYLIWTGIWTQPSPAAIPGLKVYSGVHNGMIHLHSGDLVSHVPMHMENVVFLNGNEEGFCGPEGIRG